MERSDTPTRLRVAATRLYSSAGVGATSVRAIIREAGVNLNALHYHFGSKSALTRVVFEHVMEPFRQERLTLLGRLGPNAGVRQGVEALYWPLFRRAARAPGSSARRGLSIVAQIRKDPAPDSVAILEAHEEAFLPVLEAHLRPVLGVSADRLQTPLRFIESAAWDLVSQPQTIASIQADDPDLSQTFREFVRFAESGLEGIR